MADIRPSTTTLYGFFSASKVGKDGISVTVDYVKADGTVVTGAAASAAGIQGMYKLAGVPATAGAIPCIFKTTDATVDAQHVPGLTLVGDADLTTLTTDYTTARAGYLDRLNSAISSHDAAAVITALKALLSADVTDANTLLKQIKDNLNATVGSRSSHSAADVWLSGTRTLSGFGTLISDIVTAVLDTATTAGHAIVGSIGKAIGDAGATADPNVIATAVWAAGTRTLTSLGTAVADIVAAVLAGLATLISQVGTIYTKVRAPGAVGVVSPGPTAGGLITIIPGDAYSSTHDNPVPCPIPSAPDLTGATLAFTVDGAAFSVVPTVEGAGEDRVANVELSAAQTETLRSLISPGTPSPQARVYWRVVATWSADSPLQPQTISWGEIRRSAWDAR